MELSRLPKADELYCTKKAQDHVQSYHKDLSGRERQLLLLMMRNDTLSCKARSLMTQKVDIISLIKNGYLEVEDEALMKEIRMKNSQCIENFNDDLKTLAQSNVDPALQLLAGYA